MSQQIHRIYIPFNKNMIDQVKLGNENMDWDKMSCERK